MTKNSNLYAAASPLTPLSFLANAARSWPERVAIHDGEITYTYQEFMWRCTQLAAALHELDIEKSATVSVIAKNSAMMLEAHFGVPMAACVINTINIRLDAASIAYILSHAETKVLIVEDDFLDLVGDALERMEGEPPMVVVRTASSDSRGKSDFMEYETFLQSGSPNFCAQLPDSEQDPISLNYTSGTTGKPKGVVYTHRGAYLAAVSNGNTFGLSGESVYLWTLPMFHCNGWTFPWAVTSVGATHVCLAKVVAEDIYELIEAHGVTHLCGAPIVLAELSASDRATSFLPERKVLAAIGGAAPPSSVIAKLEQANFEIVHLYGQTETYGPSTHCIRQPNWRHLPNDEYAALLARQGVPVSTITSLQVASQDTHLPVPKDGETLGEIMLQGHTIMHGYLKDEISTSDVFREGWYHTGDLAVWHEDGYVEIKDRSKDIIISGGENISSIEVEEVLYKHPLIREAAVVAMPHKRWGETPVAFVVSASKDGDLTEKEVIDFCRQNLPHFKCPTRVEFGEIPKTATGKVQKYELRQRAASLESR